MQDIAPIVVVGIRVKKMNSRWIGIVLIIFSIVLLALLTIVKLDLDERDTFMCAAVHANPNADMTLCPVHTSYTSWYIAGAFAVAFLVLAAGIYLVFVPLEKVSSAVEKATVEVSKLDEEEKRVYELLKFKDGSMYQSDLVKEVGWSKVQVTRVLDKLEGKGILERKRRGMTNIVILR